MAEEPIRKEDIIDVDGVQAGLNEVIKLITAVIDLQDKLKAQAKDMVNPLGALSANSKEDQVAIAAYAKEVDNLVKAKKGLTDTEKKLLRIQDQLKHSLSDTAYREAELKAAIYANNKAQAEAVKYNNAAEGSLTRLRIELNRKKRALEDSSPGNKKLKKEYDDLYASVTKLEKGMGVHSRGVGSYKESILGAARSLGGFLGITSLAAVAVTNLKKSLESTSWGMKTFTNLGLQFKQVFYDILHGGDADVAALDRFKQVKEVADELSRIREGDLEDITEIARMEANIAKYRYLSTDATKETSEQTRYLNLAIEEENRLIDYRLKDIDEQIDGLKKQLALTEDDYNLKKQIKELEAERYRIETDRSIRLQSRLTSLERKGWDAWMKEIEEANEKADKETSDRKKAQIAEDKAFLDQLYNQLVKEEEDAEKLKEKTWDEGMKYAEALFQKNKKDQADLGKQHEESIKKRNDSDEQAEEDRRAALQATGQVADAVYSAMASSYQKAMNRELVAAGDNEAKKEAIRKKYFEREKRLAITMAVIKGAVAVVNAWQEGSLYENIAETIAIAAMTAGEIATIDGEQYAHGGSGVLGGRPHISGGVPIPGFGTAEAGEHLAITSRAMTSKYGSGTLDAISNSINQGKFFEVWGNTARSFSNDPYTRKMYELMMKTPVIYADSYGNTVKQYPDGKTIVIKKVWLN